MGYVWHFQKQRGKVSILLKIGQLWYSSDNYIGCNIVIPREEEFNMFNIEKSYCVFRFECIIYFICNSVDANFQLAFFSTSLDIMVIICSFAYVFEMPFCDE